MQQPVVLVVEDNAAIRKGVVDALRAAGYSTRECARGDEAAHRALETPLDLVLLDVMLPGIDGFTLLEDLRRSRPRIGIIMLRARGAEDDRVRGLHLGADDYVVKPFSPRSSASSSRLPGAVVASDAVPLRLYPVPLSDRGRWEPQFAFNVCRSRSACRA